MTRSALIELQPAIYARLTNDTTLMAIVSGVFDFGAVPVDQAYPFIAIGDDTEGPLNAFGRRGYLATVTLHIFDNTAGFNRCKQILGNMNRLLDQNPFTLASMSLVYCLYEFSATKNDPGVDNIRHMPVRYSSFVQE